MNTRRDPPRGLWESRQTLTHGWVYSPTPMPPRAVAVGLRSRLKSISDVAQDLEREISRPQRGNGSGISAMVAHIRAETNAALRLLDGKRSANTSRARVDSSIDPAKSYRVPDLQIGPLIPGSREFNELILQIETNLMDLARLRGFLAENHEAELRRELHLRRHSSKRSTQGQEHDSKSARSGRFRKR